MTGVAGPEVQCPYCGKSFTTGAPNLKALFPKTDRAGLRSIPRIESVPYTRDVGQFDPPKNQKYDSPEGWSRIGSDYLSWLSWERIGVLRVPKDKPIHVAYRVQRCMECGALFDVYANYTKDREISEFWPHVFGTEAGAPDEIIEYSGASWVIWLIRKLGKILRSPYLGAVAIGLILLLIGLVPIFINTTDLSAAEVSQRVILHCIASLGVIILLALKERYIDYLQTTEDFKEVFKVQRRRGVTHWRNYTLSRYVGVQRDGHLPSLTQVDIVSGGFSVAIMLFIWVFDEPSRWIFVAGILGLLVIVIAEYRIWGRLKEKPTPQRLSLAIAIVLGLITIIGGVLLRINRMGVNSLGAILEISELSFWIIFAYIIGISVLVALNSAFYVMQGLIRIPMNLSPYNDFLLAKPLRKLERYSIGVLTLTFVTVIGIVFVLLLMGSENWDWLLDWMRWGLTFLFAAVGFGLNRGEYFGVAILYVSLSILFDYWHPIKGLFFDEQLLLLGFYFTALLGFHIARTDQFVTDLLQDAKNRELKRIQKQIEHDYELLDRLEQTAKGSGAMTVLDEISKYHTQRQSILEDIESWLRLKDRVDTASTQSIRKSGKILESLTPLLTSVILPVFGINTPPWLEQLLKLVFSI